MKLLDTNILIYSANPLYEYLRPLVMDTSNYVSAISMVETLGYHNLHPVDKRYFESIFQILKIIPLEQSVLDKTIELRQTQNVKLADSLIAASAMIFNLEIYTRNISDFQKIEGLTVVNPIH